jgi:hypothetical protein
MKKSAATSTKKITYIRLSYSRSWCATTDDIAEVQIKYVTDAQVEVLGKIQVLTQVTMQLIRNTVVWMD